MSIFSSGSVRFSGVASGLDTDALIRAYTDVARKPLLRLNAKSSELDKAKSLFADLATKLDTLESALRKMDTDSEFGSKKVTSSDPDAVKATAGLDALSGTVSISVSTLAKAQTTVSDAVSSADSSVGTGSIDLVLGNGDRVEVEVGSNATLNDVASAINAADVGVRASVLQTGTDSFVLSTTSTETGTANSFSIDSSDFTGEDGFGGLGASTAQSAVDASFSVNGISMTRSSNSVDDVLEGVSLELLEADAAKTITLTVDTDYEGVEAELQELVDAYNEVTGVIAAAGGNSGPSGVGGALGTIGRTLRNALQSTASSVSGSTSFDNLARLGITTGADGKLSIDSDDLKAALEADFSGVSSFVTNSTDGFAGALKTAIDSLSNGVDGVIDNRMDAIDRRTRDLDQQSLRMEGRIDRETARLEERFGALESLLGSLNAQGSTLAGLFS